MPIPAARYRTHLHLALTPGEVACTCVTVLVSGWMGTGLEPLANMDFNAIGSHEVLYACLTIIDFATKAVTIPKGKFTRRR